jgi:hypothetical protein
MYMKRRKTPNAYSELTSENEDPIAQLYNNAVGAIPNVNTSANESNCTPISVAVRVMRATRPSSVSKRIASHMAMAARSKYHDAALGSEKARWKPRIEYIIAINWQYSPQ